MTRGIRHLVLLAVLLTAPGQIADADARPVTAAELADRHRRWLDEVAVLLTTEERKAFAQLERDEERDRFTEAFWSARDPRPQTPRNEFRDGWEQRLREARQRWGTVGSDRARVFLLAGDPDVRLRRPCSRALLPLEIWGYSHRDGIEEPVAVVFFRDSHGDADYRAWDPGERLGALLPAGATPPETAEATRGFLARSCDDGGEIELQLERAVSVAALRARRTPAVDGQWVASFLEPSAPDTMPLSFEATLSVEYPERHGSRTVVQATVAVPIDTVLAQAEQFRFLVDGEVLRRDRPFESFRYRYELPATSVDAGTIPLVFQRHLAPGAYRLIVRVEDLVRQRSFRDTRELEVPIVTAEAQADETATAKTAATASAAPFATTREALPAPVPDDVSVTLLRPPGGLHTGRLRVQASTTGNGIDKVAFELNGRRLMSKRRPPWSIEVDLGHAPRFHNLRAVAIGPDGETLATDEITVNAGPQRFALRLVEPEPGGTYTDSLRARAVVDVPRGARLDRVEFYLNEQLLSTLYQGPFVQSLLLPEPAEMAYLRAVAFLDDGHSAEALVFINAPAHLDRLDVDLVELYTTVVDRRGRPVEGLEADDFVVYENQVRQQLQRFELAEDLPFHAAVVIDTSTSMVSELRDAERAALDFFHGILTPRDRAAVLTFADRPRLVVPFTNDLEELDGGLAGLVAEGETALHDAIVHTVYHFGGLRGQRALILLTDGLDSLSRYTFSEALEFARETGVAVYAIGLDIPTTEHEARAKLIRLCRETGGQHFFISQIGSIDRVYETIERELRSQYLLAYQSSLADARGFREVRVEVSDPTLVAKTIRGYHP